MLQRPRTVTGRLRLRRARAAWPLGLLAGVLLLAGGHSTTAQVRPLTLYEKLGRAPLSVWGEVSDGEHRFAVIRTLEVLRCDIPERPGASFRIAFRLDSFLRAPWQDKIEFRSGERVLLFLRKFTREDGEKPDGDLYTLMWGAEGRLTLPEEGEAAWVGAARALSAIMDEEDFDKQAVMLSDSLQNENPLIAEAAFDEMLKQGLGDADLIPVLLEHFENRRETLRIGAMRLLRRILADARIAERAIPSREDLSDRVRGRAALDPSVPFRVEAVLALAELGGDDVRAFLQRLAEEDPSQAVRYEAQKSLMGWPARR